MEAAKAGGPLEAEAAKEALRTALTQITKALARQELSAAAVAMKTANEICAQLSQQGIALDPAERPAFEALAAACGVALDHAGRDLQAASNKRENIRRGMNAYIHGE